jgi:geranylgeranyl pyrophosphate synthase
MKALDLGAVLGLGDLPARLQAVEESLVSSVSFPNDYLSSPAIRVIQGGGKRLRPSLVIAASLAGGAESGIERVIAGCCAVELVHVGSLVHDDVIDEASERRGVPTVNNRESISLAILVGDYLLARAGEHAASISAAVSKVLATTIGALCDGQSREMADLYNVNRGIDDFLLAIRGKTAALLSASCEIGALCGGLPDEVTFALSSFGTEFGMAFQIIDDILDLTSTTEAMGKPVGNDIREGVYTLPLLLALSDSAGDEAKALLSNAIDDPSALDGIRVLLEREGKIKEAAEVARDYNQKALDALKGIPASPQVDGLARLPGEYFSWALGGVFG